MPSDGQLGDEFGYAERIEGRDREALLAKVVERRADVNERFAVAPAVPALHLGNHRALRLSQRQLPQAPLQEANRQNHARMAMP